MEVTSLEVVRGRPRGIPVARSDSTGTLEMKADAGALGRDEGAPAAPGGGEGVLLRLAQRRLHRGGLLLQGRALNSNSAFST